MVTLILKKGRRDRIDICCHPLSVSNYGRAKGYSVMEFRSTAVKRVGSFLSNCNVDPVYQMNVNFRCSRPIHL